MHAILRALAVAFSLPVAVQGASAQEPFYKGKSLRLIISVGVAGGFGEYARTLAEHWGRHIPGHPHIIVQSMPGAGGLIATNHLAVQAPQDGTVVAMVNATAPLAPLWGSKGARFDTLKFNAIGAIDRSDRARVLSDLFRRGLRCGGEDHGAARHTATAASRTRERFMSFSPQQHGCVLSRGTSISP